MRFRDSFNKAKDAVKSAKDTVVDFVSEEIVDTGPGSGSVEAMGRGDRNCLCFNCRSGCG